MGDIHRQVIEFRLDTALRVLYSPLAYMKAQLIAA
jgi:hypothetical protein